MVCSPNCLWSGEAITVIYVFCTHFHKKGLFSHKIFITHVKTAQFVTLELSTVLHSHQQPTLYNVSTKDRKGERSTLIDPLKTASKLGCHCAHTYRTWLKTHLKRLQTLKNTLSTYCGSLVIGQLERTRLWDLLKIYMPMCSNAKTSDLQIWSPETVCLSNDSRNCVTYSVKRRMNYRE